MNTEVKECTLESCRLNPIRGDKCILHCEKHDYSRDRHESSFLSSFYSELLNYLVLQICSYGSRVEQLSLTPDSVEKYLTSDSEPSKLLRIQMAKDIVFEEIVFPCRDSRDNFDYFKLLRNIKSVHFDRCSFYSSGIDINSLKVFFQDCYFKNTWTVYNNEILSNVNNTLHQNCSFDEDVSMDTNYSSEKNDKCSLFTDCNFSKKLEIYNAIIENPIFNNTPNIELALQELNISNSSINGKFVVNNFQIGDFRTKNVTFNSKFEFKENKVNSFDIFNTNFHKIFDAYNSDFGSYSSKKCIFYDFSGFELCNFSSVEQQLATFEYVTFLSFVNYRNAIFHGGLNLENTNLKESINFLKAEIKSNNTNRETYRIIKNSFDKVGNHIEANKYFSLEMRQYKKELANQKMSQEKLIFWLNENISNFGMSYMRPICLIFLLSIIFQMLSLGYDNDLLYKIYPKYNSYIALFSSFMNEIASNIIPFERFLSKGMEFISLIFYLAFASLIWQTVVSIKKHTRSN